MKTRPPSPRPVKSGVALVFRLPGQTQPGMLTLSAGDVTHQIRIEPEFRPELKQMTAHIEMPAYLQYPPADQKIESGTLTFLKGQPHHLQGPGHARAEPARRSKWKKQTPLKVNGDTFSSAPAFRKGPRRSRSHGRTSSASMPRPPRRCACNRRRTRRRTVECRDMAGTIAILETEVVHVDIAAVDDYGILDVGVRWQTAPQTSRRQAAGPEDHKIASGAPQDKTVKAHYDFSPQLLHIPEGTSVAFCSTATDRFPDRPASLSSVHQIYILSRAAHAR